MRRSDLARLGAGGLGAHKLRTLLTTLGIIFGVASVIAMLSIGEGAKEEALEQFALLGVRNLFVRHVEPAADADEEPRLSPKLTLGDARSLSAESPVVEVAVPERDVRADVRAGRRRVPATIVGTTPELADVMNLEIARGRFFAHADILETRRVCVLGNAIARDLFAWGGGVGESVKISGNWYTVIGVLAPRGGVSDDVSGYVNDANRNVYVPVSNAVHRLGRDADAPEIDRIVVNVPEHADVRMAADLITRALERRHRDVDDFDILVPEELLRQRQATQRIFNVVMGAIAGISLLVGGIGIMNIMLASILERTREIGIRRAVGATRHDVMWQFLVEAVAVSVLGGVLGLALGVGLTEAIAHYAGWRTVVSMRAVILAVTVAGTVGIVFGFYPARRAATLDPIECLRYE